MAVIDQRFDYWPRMLPNDVMDKVFQPPMMFPRDARHKAVESLLAGIGQRDPEGAIEVVRGLLALRAVGVTEYVFAVVLANSLGMRHLGCWDGPISSAGTRP